MFTDVQILNLGLGKIASNRIKQITPPITPLEQFCSTGYTQWKQSELTKHRWVFATVDCYNLTQINIPPVVVPPVSPDPDFVPNPQGVRRPYQFQLPNDCLRPLRGKQSEWVQRGRTIWSGYQCLKIDYVKNVLEDQFDPLFVDVLAGRVAQETVEFVTQSNTKSQKADMVYDGAVTAAAKVNAFVIGPESMEDNDEAFDWVAGHNHDIYSSGPWGTSW